MGCNVRHVIISATCTLSEELIERRAAEGRTISVGSTKALRSTPAMVLGVADRVWTVGDFLDAALATQPNDPIVTPPDRRKRFKVIISVGATDPLWFS